MPKTRHSTGNNSQLISNKRKRAVVKKQGVAAMRPSFAAEASSFSFFGINKKTAILVIVVILLVLLGYYKKQWFIAATVNGQPISNFELLSRMDHQYRQQTLAQMINQRIILNEGKKKGITVSTDELNKRVLELEQSVGGADALDSLLTQQEQTRASLMEQLRLQVTIEKLYGVEATVSAEEIDTFVKENKEQLTATESAAQRKEAETLLKGQKLSKVFTEKFDELRSNAKVTIF